MKRDVVQYERGSRSAESVKNMESRRKGLLESKGIEKVDPLRKRMQSVMMESGSVFRNDEGLKKGIEEILSLKERYKDIGVSDQKRAFNYELMEAIELGHQLDPSEAILLSALHRRESRGAHWREDFPLRADRYYLKHSLIFPTARGPEVRYKPVKITKFQPEARVY